MKQAAHGLAALVWQQAAQEQAAHLAGAHFRGAGGVDVAHVLFDLQAGGEGP